METKIEKKSNGHGGARPGAGRKKGSKDNVTVKHLLEVLDAKSKGQSYEEILIEDLATYIISITKISELFMMVSLTRFIVTSTE